MIKVEKTPNTEYCLEVIRKAAETVKDPGIKTELMDALTYLDRSFSGESQPNRGIDCAPLRIKVRG